MKTRSRAATIPLRRLTEEQAALASTKASALAAPGRTMEAPELHGIPASAGTYTGTARVILDESQFGKIRAGDVLVCPTTSPVWSVFFGSVGALVTDVGGVLSHPAIIAREYGIPAAVATGSATELVHDGDTISVNDLQGVVEVVP